MKKPSHANNRRRPKAILIALIVLAVLCIIGFSVFALGANDDSQKYALSDGEDSSFGESATGSPANKLDEFEGFVISSESELLIESTDSQTFSFEGSKYEDVYTFFVADESLSKVEGYVGSSVVISGYVASIVGEKPYIKIESVTPAEHLIDMAYGSFALPYKWHDVIRVEERVEEAGCTYSFVGIFGDAEYELFVVGYGSGIGDIVGMIEVNSEKIDMTVLISEVPKSLSGETLENYYAAQEDINFLLENIKYNDGVLVYSV